MCNSADRTFLRKWKWSQIILDEAHALKNASSARSKRLRRLASEARGRVMLTGTPLQNDLGELLNLLVFLLPGLFKGEEPGEGAGTLGAAMLCRLQASRSKGMYCQSMCDVMRGCLRGQLPEMALMLPRARCWQLYQMDWYVESAL
jgi:hypothetical protein